MEKKKKKERLSSVKLFFGTKEIEDSISKGEEKFCEKLFFPPSQFLEISFPNGWIGNFDTRIRMRNGTLSAGIRLHFLPPSCNCRGCRQPVVSTRLDPTGNPVFARKFLSTPSTPISLRVELKLFPKTLPELRNRDENRHTEIEK